MKGKAEALKNRNNAKRDQLTARQQKIQRKLLAKVEELAKSQQQTKSALGIFQREVREAGRKAMLRAEARATLNSHMGQTFRMRGLLAKARRELEMASGLRISGEQLREAVSKVQGGEKLFGMKRALAVS